MRVKPVKLGGFNCGRAPNTLLQVTTLCLVCSHLSLNSFFPTPNYLNPLLSQLCMTTTSPIPTQIPLDGFRLRKFEKNDADSIVKYINDYEIHRNTATIPFPYTPKDARQFLKDSELHWKAGTAYRFSIVMNNEVIGCCSLDNVSKKDSTAELGYWLGKPFWGKKIMTRAAQAVIQFGFTQIQLHRISVSHIEGNIASQKIIEKLGFKYEGTQREDSYREGKWFDSKCYGLLEEEF